VLDISKILDPFCKYIGDVINDPLFPVYVFTGLLVYLAYKILEKMNFRDLLNHIDEWLKKEKKNKGTLKFFTFLIILGFCLAGCFVIFSFTLVISNQKTYSSALNDYFSIKFENEIKPQSEIEINQIVDEVKTITNLSKKLEKIADWETRNFTDIYWHHSILKGINPFANSYMYEPSGKIRAVRSYVDTPYAEDPYWITYYRFGACGEEASLFANISNRTGVITRPIVLDLGYWLFDLIPMQTGNHVFLEVQVVDNEWYYFDPTIYGADHFLNESPCKNGQQCVSRWFGKPAQYNYFSPEQVLRIYRGDTKEDVSSRYTKMSSSIRKFQRIIIKKESVEIIRQRIPKTIDKCNGFFKNSSNCLQLLSFQNKP